MHASLYWVRQPAISANNTKQKTQTKSPPQKTRHTYTRSRAHTHISPHLLLLWRLLWLLTTKHTALLHKLLLLLLRALLRLRLRLRALHKQSTAALPLLRVCPLVALLLVLLRVGPLVALLLLRSPRESLRWRGLSGACCHLGSRRRDGQRLEGSNKPTTPGATTVSEAAARACRRGPAFPESGTASAYCTEVGKKQ